MHSSLVTITHYGDVHKPLMGALQGESINKKELTLSEFLDEHGNFNGLELGWRLMYDDLNPTFTRTQV